ncbi:MAG: DNA repair protein RecN, partial [Clostridia bacterium]|nr:DNA repair protein RecN [Clostridia bacterium]
CFKDVQPIEKCTFNTTGIDEVEFLFSANAGEKEKSLAKTISGGEMSRFMLAIKNVFAATDDVELLVFDEIDSGVSGEIGYKVGQKLAVLSKKYQIICITHLPQVTALADCFINIKKYTENNHTKSVASYLDNEQLIEYLTSLFGSNKSQAGLLHAQELLDMATTYKSELNKL